MFMNIIRVIILLAIAAAACLVYAKHGENAEKEEQAALDEMIRKDIIDESVKKGE